MKVKSNELRLGNLIGCDGNILIVEKIDIQNNIGCSLFEKSKGQHANSGNKYFIPLTEEWLLNFGFEKFIYDSEETGFGVEYELKASPDVFLSYSDDFSLGIYSEESRKENDMAVIPTHENIKHVHQLQNLYFALTGEELTLKTT